MPGQDGRDSSPPATRPPSAPRGRRDRMRGARDPSRGSARDSHKLLTLDMTRTSRGGPSVGLLGANGEEARREGEIPVIRFGERGHVRFRIADIEEFIERREED